MEKVQRRFGADIGMWLREAICEEGRTRSSLARGLCEVADWRNAKGDFCLASARRASGFGGGSGRAAFAAACRVFDIARAAKETPDAPAVDIVPQDAPGIVEIALES